MSAHVISAAELDHGKTLKPKAELSCCEYCPGSWCQFCKAHDIPNLNGNELMAHAQKQRCQPRKTVARHKLVESRTNRNTDEDAVMSLLPAAGYTEDIFKKSSFPSPMEKSSIFAGAGQVWSSPKENDARSFSSGPASGDHGAKTRLTDHKKENCNYG